MAVRLPPLLHACGLGGSGCGGRGGGGGLLGHCFFFVLTFVSSLDSLVGSGLLVSNGFTFVFWFSLIGWFTFSRRFPLPLWLRSPPSVCFVMNGSLARHGFLSPHGSLSSDGSLLCCGLFDQRVLKYQLAS